MLGTSTDISGAVTIWKQDDACLAKFVGRSSERNARLSAAVRLAMVWLFAAPFAREVHV